MRQKTKPKSPLKIPPRKRLPGQSLDEEIQYIINDKSGGYAFLLAFCFAFMVSEWAKYLFDIPHSPVLVSICCLVIMGYALYHIFQYRHRIQRLKRGRDGERVVAEHLDDLREKGYIILHDVLGENFNIDHVIIGRTGVYLAETKTYSKPFPHARIVYDGEDLTIAGARPVNNITGQVKALCNWLKPIVKTAIEKDIFIRPVLLFPGWYTETDGKNPDIWVLEPKALPKFIQNEKNQDILSKKEIKDITMEILRHQKIRY